MPFTARYGVPFSGLSNEVLAAQLTRRSVRKFGPRDVTEDELTTLVAAAQSAPTSSNLQFDKVIQVFVMVIAPVTIGMLVRALAPAVADRLSRPVRVLSLLVLVSVVALVLHAQREHLGEYFVEVGPAALVFNLLSLLAGYCVPRLIGVDHASALAAGFEIGIHNTALAMTVALSPALLNNAEMAVPAVVYGIVMFFTALGFGWLSSRQSSARNFAARPANR
ncbi:nitroreductase family protein [Actinoplanes sp. CA-015351]|uniref:nitroreductase family protein n=1 Tax=Actinoplanes sp. CA-015351 TaxID=3239897 RepID=UPI003D98E639